MICVVERYVGDIGGCHSNLYPITSMEVNYFLLKYIFYSLYIHFAMHFNYNYRQKFYMILQKFETKILLLMFVGPKELAIPAHFISSPWLMPRKKKCPRMNKESLDHQDVLPRTTLSSADQDHERGRCHATKGSLLECPNGRPKRRGPAIGAWRRSNPRKGLHLCIKYPQLTSRPH